MASADSSMKDVFQSLFGDSDDDDSEADGGSEPLRGDEINLVTDQPSSCNWRPVAGVPGLWLLEGFLNPEQQGRLMSCIDREGWFAAPPANQAMRFFDLPKWTLSLSSLIHQAASAYLDSALNIETAEIGPASTTLPPVKSTRSKYLHPPVEFSNMGSPQASGHTGIATANELLPPGRLSAAAPKLTECPEDRLAQTAAIAGDAPHNGRLPPVTNLTAGKAIEQCPLPEHLLQREPLFDQMIANSYQPGEGIGPHVDLMRFEDGIAIVSLLSPCVMTFARVKPTGGKAASTCMDGESLPSASPQNAACKSAELNSVLGMESGNELPDRGDLTAGPPSKEQTGSRSSRGDGDFLPNQTGTKRQREVEEREASGMTGAKRRASPCGCRPLNEDCTVWETNRKPDRQHKVHLADMAAVADAAGDGKNFTPAAVSIWEGQGDPVREHCEVSLASRKSYHAQDVSEQDDPAAFSGGGGEVHGVIPTLYAEGSCRQEACMFLDKQRPPMNSPKDNEEGARHMLRSEMVEEKTASDGSNELHKMDLRSIGGQGEVEVLLSPGDLLLVWGEARYDWTHAIYREKGRQIWGGQELVQNRRVSITLRRMRRMWPQGES